METIFPILVAALAMVAVAGVFFALLKTLMVVVRPDEVAVFSGGSYPAEDGSKRGWLAIGAGRRMRIPIIEKVNRLDLTSTPVDFSVEKAYSKSTVLLRVEATANVRISSHMPLLDNAVANFLGQGKQVMVRQAKETLEGHLRTVLATMLLEEINKDWLRLAEKIHHEATPDFAKLGLLLDVPKIQNVADDRDVQVA